MTLIILTPPSAEPVTLDEAKAHLRVTFADEDALIARLIVAARERIEAELGLCLLETTLRETREETWRSEPDRTVVLARGPLIAVDAVGVEVAPGEFDLLPAGTYVAEPGARPARLTLDPARPRRAVGWRCATLRIDYRAGFGAASADVPEGLRQAVLALVAEGYESRADGRPLSPAAAEPWQAPWRRARL